MKNKFTLNRKSVLRGLGGSFMALPYLEAMSSQEIKKIPKRMAIVCNGLGFVPSRFFPEQQGLDYKSPTLIEPLDVHKKDFTIFGQLDHDKYGQGGHQGVHTFLSGIPGKMAKSYDEGNISLDQKVAEELGNQTRFPSLHYSIFKSMEQSWTRTGVAIKSQTDPEAIYRSLFHPLNQNEKEAFKKNHLMTKSILDLVRHDAKQMNKILGAEDKDKMDEYFTSVRDIESRINQSREWLDIEKPNSPKGYGDQLKDVSHLPYAMQVPIFYDLMALTLQTDSTRVVTFTPSDIGHDGGGISGVEHSYHDLSHHGKQAGHLAELTLIEKFQTEQFSRFLTKLKSIREADGSRLFDHTMSLLGSGMGNAAKHSNYDLPVLLAGGGFKHKGHLVYQKDKQRNIRTPLGKLFVTMLQHAGVETDTHGTTKGTLPGFGEV